MLDSFAFKDISIENPRLLAASNGSIYFTSQDPPFPHTFPSNGRINKIDKDLDTIEWSFLLPSNPFVDGHRYKVYDYLETKEGDIVLCGTVWEEGPDGPIATPEDHTWNGFISKIDSLGQFKWLRIYRHPNNHPLLQSADYGKFRPSYLNKIYELPNHNLIVAGSAYFDPYQEFALPSNEIKSSIWLMNVDSVGCLDNEECTLTILLDSVNNQLPNFQIGTSWTYEVEEYPLPIHVTYQKYTISDTSSIDGKRVFVIENDFDNEIEFMYENENMVYFWDDRIDSFRLHYNFNDILEYSSPWSARAARRTMELL